MDARALIGVIGDWSAGTGPLYRQLAAAVADAIERGDLSPGARLPAERSLADALPASRGTVVSAFGLLAEAGAVVRRQGSGTSVDTSQPPAREAVQVSVLPKNVNIEISAIACF